MPLYGANFLSGGEEGIETNEMERRRMVKFSEATDSMQLTRKHDSPLASRSDRLSPIQIKVSTSLKKNPAIR